MSWEDIEARRELKGQEPKSDAEEKLNKLFLACFSTPAGQQVIEYLKAMTIYRISGAEYSDAALRHLEGQRFLVAGIMARIQRGSTTNEANDE